MDFFTGKVFMKTMDFSKSLTRLCFGLAVCATSNAAPWKDQGEVVAVPDTLAYFTLGVGYSHTDIDLNFFSSGELGVAPGVNLLNKNVQVKWRDLDAFKLNGTFRVKSNLFYLRSMADWGDINSGSQSIGYTCCQGHKTADKRRRIMV